MELNFLIWFFLAGILTATAQDLKRREVDNWLNYFLLLGGFSFIFFRIILERDFMLIFISIFVLAVMFLLMNVFYYGRVFGGGDAFLLFAMSPLFVEATYFESAVNIGIFTILLFVSGAVIGLIISAWLYFSNFKKVNKEMKKNFKKTRVILIIMLILGAVTFIVSYFYFYFLFFAVIFALLPFAYIFGKSLESVAMIREISTKKLREGDWLVHDERVGNKIVKTNWEGLSAKEIKILQKKKSVKIKEGLPFVPAFLVGFILYVVLRTLW